MLKLQKVRDLEDRPFRWPKIASALRFVCQFRKLISLEIRSCAEIACMTHHQDCLRCSWFSLWYGASSYCTTNIPAHHVNFKTVIPYTKWFIIVYEICIKVSMSSLELWRITWYGMISAICEHRSRITFWHFRGMIIARILSSKSDSS